MALQTGDVPVAILAGGLATRLGPLTETIPKALVEVAGRPFIDHQLALLRRHGMRRVVLCLGHCGEQIEAHVGDGARSRPRDRAIPTTATALLGTGGALRRAAAAARATLFWVLYGDSYLDIDYAAVLADVPARAAPGR